MIISKKLKNVQDVLMEPSGRGDKEVYFIIDSKDQSIFVVNSGKVGVEFYKTRGARRADNGVAIYQCLYGQGILIMQRNEETGEAKEFKVVTIQQGRQIVIPAGFYFSLINVGKGYLVVLDNYAYDPKMEQNYEISLKRGFAYYVIEKKGEIAFEQNPNYKVLPQITTE